MTSFELSINFFRKNQQFFMSDFLHSKYARRRRICGMSRAEKTRSCSFVQFFVCTLFYLSETSNISTAITRTLCVSARCTRVTKVFEPAHASVKVLTLSGICQNI